METATKKITKTEYFTMIKEVVEASDAANAEELVAFIDTQIEQIASKASKAKERAAERKAKGDELRDAVQAVLTGEYQNIDTIMEQIELTEVDGKELSRAMVSARLTQLVKAEIAEKDQQKNADGKKAMFYRLIEG